MRTIITISFFLLTVKCWSQINDTYAFFTGSYDKDYIRKHKIRQVITTGYTSGKKSSSQPFFNFDRQGLLTTQRSVDSNGKKINEYIFRYDKQGEQIERKNIDYVLNKTYTVTFDRRYSGTRLVQESSSELPYITRHIYNTKGQRVQSITTLGIDSNAAKRVFCYTYDANGKLLLGIETLINNNDSAPAITGKYKYVYDVKGKPISVVREGKANYELHYNKKGLLTIMNIKMPEEFSNMEISDRYTYFFWR